MKTLAFSAWATLNAGTALAHTSVVPHVHPHSTSVLPDALALVLAAALVGTGVIVFRWVRLKKE
jgi:hypothetical protein